MRTRFLAGPTLAVLTLLAGVAAQADNKVGVTAAVNPQAIGQPPTEPERVLLVGTDNFANEKITTGPEGQVQLLFVDGSSVSVGPNANLTIDQFVYDPTTKKGKLALSATQGVFRLVGGAISKSDEVTITTPTMTAGIRGGIGVVSVQPNQPATAAFLFGALMRVVASGVAQEITRPGFFITVVPGQPPGPPTRMTSGEVQGALGQFHGKKGSGQGQAGQAGGQTGQGGGEPQQDQALASSKVSAATGSALSPFNLSAVNQVPVTQFQQLPLNPNTNTQINNAITTSTSSTTTSQGSTSQALYGAFYADDLFVQGSFNPQNGSVTYSKNVFKDTFVVNGSNVTFNVPSDNGGQQSVTVPFATGLFNITLPQGTAVGATIVDPGVFIGGFGTFTPNSPTNGCGQSSQSKCQFGFFGGVPTVGLPTSGFSTYQVVPIFQTLPFFHGKPPTTGAIASSQLYVAWSPVTNPTAAASSQQRAALMQASLYISGTGTNQQSGLFGITGAFFQEQNSTISANAGMVGQSRDCAGCVTTRYGGGAMSAQISTPSGLGNAIYGPNARYIVFVPDIPTPVVGGPDTRTPGAQTDIPFDTLTSQQANNPGFFLNPAVQLTLTSTTTANRSDTTSSPLVGYTGGILDRRVAGASTTFSTDLFGSPFTGTPSVQIFTNPNTNKMSANFGFINYTNGDSYNLVFGNPNGSLGTRGTFINDLIFASREALDTSGNPMSTLNSSPVAFNRLFMVPASVVPIDLQSFAGPGVTACACQFLQWGWWVGEVQNTSSSSSLRERFQLATWVAGVLPGTSQLPSSLGAVNYAGHAVGNVAVNGGAGAGGATYVAAGNFNAQWDFNSKHFNSFAISNWDRGGAMGSAGINITGSGGDGVNPRDFTGTLSGPSSITGSFGGSIFRSPADVAAYIAGNFRFATPSQNYKAAGIFAGQR
jgi:hypothetical protein